jgi:alpha-tubulin suppressor-like RCC1 family protein
LLRETVRGALVVFACWTVAILWAPPAIGASIAAGGAHNLLLRDDGTLWAWGDNEYGQLGDGTTLSRSAPVMVLTGVKAIGAGAHYSFAIRSDDSLWAWGNNSAGQLGDGTYDDRTTPVRVLTSVRTVAGGQSHSLAIRLDGTLWSWGSSQYGQLGDGSTGLRNLPAMILDDVTAISTGESHSAAVRSNGDLFAWGRNQNGRLGDGTATSRSLPVKVLSGVQSVAAGAQSTFAIRTDGSLWGWGGNSTSQLGDGTTTERLLPVLVMQGVKAVATARGFSVGHTLAIKLDGSLVGWGYNFGGQVGDGTTSQRFAPTAVTTAVQAVAAGNYHSIGVKEDGTVWTWGENEVGQLGVATVASRSTPVTVLASGSDVAAGGFHSLALKADRSLWAWGSNATGQLGNGTETDTATPTLVLSDVRAVATGGFYDFGHTLALKTDGTLWTWGDNIFGQLGDASSLLGRSAPALVLSDVQGIGAGDSHSFAIKADGSLWAWGYNDSGQLGDGTTTNRTLPVSVLSNVQLASGGALHSLAVRNDGSLWAWGINYAGQLGDGSTVDRRLPVKVMEGVKSAVAGSNHSIALKHDGTVWTWGVNFAGQLGDGTTVSRTTPQQILSGMAAIGAGKTHSLAIANDGTVWTWGALPSPATGGGIQLSPRQNLFLRNVTRIASGWSHALAVTAQGKILAWGDNARQQIGIPHPAMSAVPLRVRDPLSPYAGAELVVEYFNPTIRNGAGTPGIGHYFITAAAAEIASIDTGGSGPGWSRTGRTFRAWLSAEKAPPTAVGVCRFYARAPNSHFYTASPEECQVLRNQNPTNSPDAGWAYEGIAFYSMLPSAVGCPAAYHPVYRSYNRRFDANPAFNDGNHRITPSYNDYQRSIRFFGFADEGIAFCSPIGPDPGGDLQATFSYPGASLKAGDPVTVEFLVSNNGAGAGGGATVHALLAPEVIDWSVTCEARNGALCPAALAIDPLREGAVIGSWPAGGSLRFTARGIAPQISTNASPALVFAAAVANASGSPDATPANDVPPMAQTVVKGTSVCDAVLNPAAIQLSQNAQSPHVGLIIGNGCGWNAASSAPWITVAPSGGSGDATVVLSVAANTGSEQRIASVTIGGRTLAVTQTGTPAASGGACDSMRLQREGDQVSASGLTGALSFDVVADSRCAWRATSNTSWITVTAGAGGNGNGVVSYLVESYADLPARAGTITVGPKAFTINQLGNVVAPGGDSGGDGGSGGSSGGGSSGGGAG